MSPEYHAWTHRPKAQGGTDPIEVASSTTPYVFRVMTTNLTINAGGAGDGLIFQTNYTDASEGRFSIIDSGSTRIEGQGTGSKGKYEFSVGIKWNTPFDAPSMVVLNCGAFGWFPSGYWKELFSGGSPQSGSVAQIFHCTARISDAFDTDIDIQIIHQHGSNQLLTDATFEMAYLGPWTGTAPGTYNF